MRNKYVGQPMLLAMAQDSFETGNNRFATMIPLATMAGEAADADEFPNRGLVWWLVSGGPDVLRSRPGRLLVGTIEESREQGTSNPEKDFFQVNFNTVQPAGAGRFIQVITPPDHTMLSPEDVLERCQVRLAFEPTTLVLVRLGSRLIGPFRTETDMEVPGRWRVAFQKASADRPVHVIADAALKTHRFAAEVSLDGASPQRSNDTRTCDYELAVWSDFQAAQAQAQTMRLSTEEEAIGRAAKAVLSRSQRQQLNAQLKELGALAGGGVIDQGDLEILTRVQSRVEATTRGIEGFIDAVIESGRLNEKVDARVAAEIQRQVEARSATLNAQAEERARELTGLVEEKSKELKRLTAETERQRRHAEAELAEQMTRKRADLESELSDLRSGLDQQRAEIEQQRSLVEGSLKSVVDRFESGRQSLIGDFLAIQPVLERAGLAIAAPAAPALHAAPAPRAPPASPIILPEALSRDLAGQGEVEEEAFFERFREHVAACGFRYDRADLAAFHLSVKCTDFVVIGGVSGTGKSSLPKLYAQAIAGEGGDDSPRFLNIDVNPSWTNPADILGYVNLLDSRFHPAAAGIFAHLARAALESEAKRGDEGLYFLCLDEMNLAQVEHYFSGFIQALSRAPGHRQVTVFDPSSLAPDDPLRRWASLPLGDNVRFLGTVNFDETTKPLSQRVLDRADLITLEPAGLFDLEGTASTARAAPKGPPVRQSDLRAWVSERPLSPEAVTLLGDLQEPLHALGCALTPRRQSAIQRFVSSAPASLCSPEEALDMQLAQRVVPQVKGLFRADARRALDRIVEVIGRERHEFARTMRMIAQLRDRDDDFENGWPEA